MRVRGKNNDIYRNGTKRDIFTPHFPVHFQALQREKKTQLVKGLRVETLSFGVSLFFFFFFYFRTTMKLFSQRINVRAAPLRQINRGIVRYFCINVRISFDDPDPPCPLVHRCKRKSMANRNWFAQCFVGHAGQMNAAARKNGGKKRNRRGQKLRNF